MGTHLRWESGAIALTVVACSSVSGSDPGFWEQSRDLGGTQYDFASGAPAGGVPAAGQSGAGNEIAGNGTVLPTGGAPTDPGAGGNSSLGGWMAAAGGGFGESGGTFGAGGALVEAAGGGTVGPATKCTFTFNVTTVTARGRYAPRNVGAIWIQDASNKFVKSLNVWGTIRLSNATAWTTVSGNNTVDAVTGATRANHGPLTANWDCTNTSHAPIADGGYQICATFAEDDAFPFFGPTPHQACAPFQKGSAPVDSTPPDATNFTSMHVVLQ